MPTAPLLIYLHGFGSSPASKKCQLLAKAMAELGYAEQYLAPFLPPDPEQVVHLLQGVIEGYQNGPIVLVGSSLGGFYATYFAERHGLKAILINPAVKPWDKLEVHLGTFYDPYSQRSYEIRPEFQTALKRLQIKPLTRPHNLYLLLQTGDEVLDYREAKAEYAGAKCYIEVGGTHAFEHFERLIPEVLQFAGINVGWCPLSL